MAAATVKTLLCFWRLLGPQGCAPRVRAFDGGGFFGIVQPVSRFRTLSALLPNFLEFGLKRLLLLVRWVNASNGYYSVTLLNIPGHACGQENCSSYTITVPQVDVMAGFSSST